MKQNMNSWMLWLALNVLIGGYFAYAMLGPASSAKGSLLPGATTHGHYQIELACNACHSPDATLAANATIGPVMQDACNRCHQEQLELADDTHPAIKFSDPTNAELLQTLDAQNCLTCHKEHVPEQTATMGLTVPSDYCWHCHQEIGETRPSHAKMSFDSCATAGCHNYHDNRAIYERYLNEHFGEPDFFTTAILPSRNFADVWNAENPDLKAIHEADADSPESEPTDSKILSDWAQTKHAAAGVNCSGCHTGTDAEEVTGWSDAVSLETCKTCHKQQTDSFLTGKHGMRLAQGLSPMTPATARLEMHAGAAHKELNCTACHQDHRFDTQFAAAEACQGCHADSHSLSYDDSSHADLWRQELAGDLPAGSGVSCASCHLPRMTDGDAVWVNHDQNAGLRPNETMARQVCQSCHGLEFSLSSLADPALLQTCYDRPPTELTDSVQMAHDWFEQQRIKKELRAKQRAEKRKPK